MGSSAKILTTHGGSLIRPPELIAILRARESGSGYDAAAYENILKGAIATVVREQAATGIDVVSDGEFGKSISWSRYIVERISGFEQRFDESAAALKKGEVVLPSRDRRAFPEFFAEYDKTQGLGGSLEGWVCYEPIKYVGQAALAHDIANFKAALAGVEVADGFMPVVAPASVLPYARDEYYSGDKERLFAIAAAMAHEYRAIVDAGLIVQIDDAWLPDMYDKSVPPWTMEEYRRWAGLCVDALNHAIGDIPPDRVRYHICWGSFNSPHTGDVPLKEIVDLVLSIRAGGFSIEMANPRHEHEWRLWENVRLPPGSVLIPGVISHQTNVVEHPELVAERITRLARLVGRENVVAGTDCGFAQGPFVRRVHPSIMWAKLHSLAEGAQIATRELFG